MKSLNAAVYAIQQIELPINKQGKWSYLTVVEIGNGLKTFPSTKVAS